MLEKWLVRRRPATPPRRRGWGTARSPAGNRPALPLSLRPPRARDGHYSDGLLRKNMEGLKRRAAEGRPRGRRSGRRRASARIAPADRAGCRSGRDGGEEPGPPSEDAPDRTPRDER